MSHSLIGAVVERNPSATPKRTLSTPSSGFPAVQHRSKSAFARARDARSKPQVAESTRKLPDPTSVGTGTPQSSIEQWREEIGRQNDAQLQAMSEEEREALRSEVFDKLGPGVEDIFRKVREARKARNDKGESAVAEQDAQTQTEEADAKGDGDAQVLLSGEKNADIAQPVPKRPELHKLVLPHRGILVSNTPPASTVSRSTTPGKPRGSVRFADVTPKDVHVYASEPSSPRRPIGLLLPPSIEDKEEDLPVLHLSTSKNSELQLIEDIRRSHFGTVRLQSSNPADVAPEAAGEAVANSAQHEEGTPEDIRRRYFPHLPPHSDPSLEWIESESTSSSTDGEAELRFDLTGSVIPVELRPSLPTHLGLHHHAGPTSAAGYTLADLLLLARSTAPAQRTMALSVLTKLVRRLSIYDKGVQNVQNRDSVRRDALVIGLEAMSERGNVGVQAIDLIFSCTVEWDKDAVDGLEFVELRMVSPKTKEATQSDDDQPPEVPVLDAADPLSSLSLQTVLQRIAEHFSSAVLPMESLSQLLSIVHRLALHSTRIASAIIDSSALITSIMKRFVTSVTDGFHPDPLAIRLLRALAASSRTASQSLITAGHADALLRFIVSFSPQASGSNSEELIQETLHFYSTLSSYGLYSKVVTTALEPFTRLSNYALSDSCHSLQLTQRWLGLVEAWLICARDPHSITPAHDLLWSQIGGWDWGETLLAYRTRLVSGGNTLSERDREDRVLDVWAMLLRSISAWCDGCRVNDPQSAKRNAEAFMNASRSSWNAQEPGSERFTLLRAERMFRECERVLSQDSHKDDITQIVRRYTQATDFLSAFCQQLFACRPAADEETHSSPNETSWTSEAYRQLQHLALDALKSSIWETDFSINAYRLTLLRSLSNFFSHFIRLARLMDDDSETWIPYGLTAVQRMIPSEEERVAVYTRDIVRILQPNEAEILQPFIHHMVWPKDAIYVAPTVASPFSLKRVTTQVLPADALVKSASSPFGVPLRRDWASIALDHLLRSGTSAVLTGPSSLPPDWNASETDLARASLSLMVNIRDRLLKGGSLQQFAMSSSETVLACMKVFMLEHEQDEKDSSEEVFRDAAVKILMQELLKPFTYGEVQRSSKRLMHTDSLEDASKAFLGSGTPFYQFYTDFVALFDAISFGDPLFARLLLPPCSVKYPLDYRKLLWGDHGDSLRSIGVEVEDVIVDDLGGYLWPFETDAEMIGWYLRALVKWELKGFVRFVAIHHIACNIWPDLQEGPIREKRARMLLLAIVNQARQDVVRDVLRYTQQREGEVRLPPDCFACDGDRKVGRLRCVGEWGGTQMMGRLEKVFGF